MKKFRNENKASGKTKSVKTTNGNPHRKDRKNSAIRKNLREE